MSMPELLTRLEKAAGPDRALDCCLWVLAKGGDARMHFVDGDTKEFVWERGVDGMWIRDIASFRVAPRYTGSVEAAVDLREQLLPGWFWRCGATTLFPNGWAHVSRTDGSNCDFRDEAACADGKAATPAIALCIAVLKAKHLQEVRA